MALDHGCDGPVTKFVLISRAIDEASKYPERKAELADELFELLVYYGWMTLDDDCVETGS
jgi:hypothetical protein